MKIFTIGFTGKTAEEFFDGLKRAGAKRVVDIRLNNVSQLAGFSKQHDLKYFLKKICRIGYEHRKTLTPTKEILNSYQNKRISWDEYEERFLKLIAGRKIEQKIKPAKLEDACLLCSEHKADKCHRRLVAEYLQKQWGNIEIIHLGY